jgi:hypothetical protein
LQLTWCCDNLWKTKEIKTLKKWKDMPTRFAPSSWISPRARVRQHGGGQGACDGVTRVWQGKRSHINFDHVWLPGSEKSTSL